MNTLRLTTAVAALALAAPALAADPAYTFSIVSTLGNTFAGTGRIYVDSTPLPLTGSVVLRAGLVGFSEGTFVQLDMGFGDWTVIRPGPIGPLQYNNYGGFYSSFPTTTATFQDGALVAIEHHGGREIDQYAVFVNISGTNVDYFESYNGALVGDPGLGSIRASGTGVVVFPTAVPEPSTLALLITGVAGIGALGRRRTGEKRKGFRSLRLPSFRGAQDPGMSGNR